MSKLSDSALRKYIIEFDTSIMSGEMNFKKIVKNLDSKGLESLYKGLRKPFSKKKKGGKVKTYSKGGKAK